MRKRVTKKVGRVYPTLFTENCELKTDHYTMALMPVSSRPTSSMLISFVPS